MSESPTFHPNGHDVDAWITYPDGPTKLCSRDRVIPMVERPIAHWKCSECDAHGDEMTYSDACAAAVQHNTESGRASARH